MVNSRSNHEDSFEKKVRIFSHDYLKCCVYVSEVNDPKNEFSKKLYSSLQNLAREPEARASSLFEPRKRPSSLRASSLEPRVSEPSLLPRFARPRLFRKWARRFCVRFESLLTSYPPLAGEMPGMVLLKLNT